MDFEKIIIGELMQLTQEDRVDAIVELDRPGIFTDPVCESLFKTIIELTLKNITPDVVSVYQANQNIPAKEISYIYSNTNVINYKEHIELLKARKYKNDLLDTIKSYGKMIKTGTHGDDIDELKNHLIADLSGIEIGSKSSFENLDFYKDKLIEHIDSNKGIEGFEWGISDLDKWTSGIVIPRVYVIGGLKKSGKTRFLIHVIKELHKQEVPTAFLSMEMPAYEITKLLHASFTGLNDVRFRTSSFLKEDERKLFNDVKINSEILGVECRSGLDLSQVLARVRRYSKMGFKVVMIDYIQRISHDRNRQAFELEDISIKLADSARQNNIALILLSQLNAAGEREAPNMGHLKGSGGIGEAADTILLMDNLYRRTKSEKDRNKLDVYIEQRHGDSGKLELYADLGSCRFGNLADENILKELESLTL